jgi:hypothetical protein
MIIDAVILVNDRCGTLSLSNNDTIQYLAPNANFIPVRGEFVLYSLFICNPYEYIQQIV